MIDWSESMQQTFEFYEVDPESWCDKERINTITDCSITRDSTTDTLESASFTVVDLVGECYIRVYLVAIQNGVKERFPLGTFLAQTPSSTFDGKTRSATVDAYSSLIELKETRPDFGYYVGKGADVMEQAYLLAKEHMRAGNIRVCEPATPSTALSYDMIAEPEDTWFSYVRDLMSSAYTSLQYLVDLKTDDEGNIVYVRKPQPVSIDFTKNHYEVEGAKANALDKVYVGTPKGKDDEVHYCIVPNTNGYRFDVDEMGTVLFAPEQDASTLRPVWTYTDDNSSILQPSVSMEHDLYGIPNKVEVLCSYNNVVYYSVATNEDDESPTSYNNRGRWILYRETNPTIYGTPTQERVDEYAKQLLKQASTVEYSITYTHGYCPVRVGDCVRINYEKAGLRNIKAKVVSQTIDCKTGCQVTETAVYTKKLWEE